MNEFVGRCRPAVLCASLVLAGVTHGAEPSRQDAARYPVAPVRAIVPYAPGGGTDILARQLGAKLYERWGQPLVVDNRAGGATIIGTELVARAPADGYTILITTGTHAVNATLHPKLPFDPVRSFDSVTLLAIAANVLVVHPSTPAKSVKEFLALAKSRPAGLSYSSSGNGGTGHLAMELLKQMSGVDIVHVPYKGAGPAVTAVVGGEVATSITNLIAALSQVKANRLRALAVTTAKRATALPEVPTIAESGYPGFDASGWFGVFVPAGTPRAVNARLTDSFRGVLKAPEVERSLAAQGAEAVGSTPEELAKWLRSEVDRWRKVLSSANIKRD